mmetsp:Transcript_12011/g.28372  ORF Transcript_12011/g.28372 Transcript_12011/m.28372 type:complete len:89 (-) Transcript_12011:1275-1541(-)
MCTPGAHTRVAPPAAAALASRRISSMLLLVRLATDPAKTLRIFRLSSRLLLLRCLLGGMRGNAGEFAPEAAPEPPLLAAAFECWSVRW